MKKQFLFLLAVFIFFSGCAQPFASQRSAKRLSCSKSDIVVLSVIGEGVAPQNAISPTQAMVLAKRAAVADAYRQLGEKLYGIKLSAKESVKDAVLKDSRIVTQVSAIIKNANIINNSYKQDLYRVMMELKISRNLLREYLYYNN